MQLRNIPGARNVYHYLFRPLQIKIRNIYGYQVIQNHTDFKPKIVCMVDGGLGSQMWQYALGLSASISSGLPVQYDVSWFDLYGKDINNKFNRNFDLLKIFHGLPFNKATKDTCKLFRRYFWYSNKYTCQYIQKVIYSKRPRYLGGYYCNYKYIDNIASEIRPLFRFPDNLLSGQNLTISKAIQDCEFPVAVHVRRGDYVGSILDVTTPQYFYNAVKMMQEKLSQPTFFIFSNDLDFCKDIFSNLPYKFCYVSGNDNDHGASDMALMCLCKHFIISNSNFSWWPAFLANNNDKTVIAPDHWFAPTAPKIMLINNNNAWICKDWMTLSTD